MRPVAAIARRGKCPGSHGRFPEFTQQVCAANKGFSFVAMDLEGFRNGKMNDVLWGRSVHNPDDSKSSSSINREATNG